MNIIEKEVVQKILTTSNKETIIKWKLLEKKVDYDLTKKLCRMHFRKTKLDKIKILIDKILLITQILSKLNIKKRKRKN